MNEHLNGLNPQQRKAVEYGKSPGKTRDVGPLLVIAGAGAGKTKALAHRVAHLIINGAEFESHPAAEVYPLSSPGDEEPRASSSIRRSQWPKERSTVGRHISLHRRSGCALKTLGWRFALGGVHNK